MTNDSEDDLELCQFKQISAPPAFLLKKEEEENQLEIPCAIVLLYLAVILDLLLYFLFILK